MEKTIMSFKTTKAIYTLKAMPYEFYGRGVAWFYRIGITGRNGKCNVNVTMCYVNYPYPASHEFLRYMENRETYVIGNKGSKYEITFDNGLTVTQTYKNGTPISKVLLIDDHPLDDLHEQLTNMKLMGLLQQ